MPVHVKNNSFYNLHLRARECFSDAFINVAKRTTLLFLSFFTLTNLSAQAWASSVNQGVSVFSTYPSQNLVKSCHLQQELTSTESVHADKASLCLEDAISPESFIEELSKSGEFSNLLPYGEGNDYELLIANVGVAPGEHEGDAKQFAEFTLQWRGIEIDSKAFDSKVIKNDSSSQDSHYAKSEAHLLVYRWLEHVKQTGLFTSQFLFQALEASNYDVALEVPDTIGEFTKLDTQLFSDPFSGAITRYTHPDFEDALVDVTVYPFLSQLALEESVLLPKQLENDLQKASVTAELQQLTLSQVNPASHYTVNSVVSGWRLGLSATSEVSPTIFATTYVFKQEDKIVKVSTTFPSDFSDTIVNQLIVQIKVPQESEMMKKVRLLLLESQR